MQKILFVPIEIKSRDYFSRLLISQIFASKGFDVYFGRKREIELLTKFFSNSFYLGLQSTKTYIPFYRKLKSLTHVLRKHFLLISLHSIKDLKIHYIPFFMISSFFRYLGFLNKILR